MVLTKPVNFTKLLTIKSIQYKTTLVVIYENYLSELLYGIFMNLM